MKDLDLFHSTVKLLNYKIIFSFKHTLRWIKVELRQVRLKLSWHKVGRMWMRAISLFICGRWVFFVPWCWYWWSWRSGWSWCRERLRFNYMTTGRTLARGGDVRILCLKGMVCWLYSACWWLLKFQQLRKWLIKTLLHVVCHDILSHFCNVQNHLQIEENLKIIVY